MRDGGEDPGFAYGGAAHTAAVVPWGNGPQTNAPPPQICARGCLCCPAPQAGHTSLVSRLLRHGADVDLVCAEGVTAIQLAAEHGTAFPPRAPHMGQENKTLGI